MALPVAIVDAVNNDELMYGEVIVYDVDVSSVSGRNVNCTVVTLRFTEFSSKCSVCLCVCVCACV